MSFRPAPSSTARPFKRRRQQGVALWTVVVLALLLGLLALSQTNSVVGQFRTSRNERDLALARQAAEAALRDAEADITCQVWKDGILTEQLHSVNDIVNTYCLGSAGKLCGQALGPTQDERGMKLLGRFPSSSTNIDWERSPAACTDGSCALPLGTKTNAPPFDDKLIARPPRYHIEVLDTTMTGSTVDFNPLFRITARGYGATTATVVDLQEVYRPCK